MPNITSILPKKAHQAVHAIHRHRRHRRPAVVVITTVANVIARLGIDASYVTQGVRNRNKLCKGKHGDLWSLLFAVLEFRTAEVEFAKVNSHLEDVGVISVEEHFGLI